MNLIPWKKSRGTMLTPFHDIDSAFEEIFNEPISRFLSNSNLPLYEHALDKAWVPAIDIRELDDKLEVTADLPGLDKKDLDVSVNEDILTIKGEKKSEKEISNENGFIRSERAYGAFSRSLKLPAKIESKDIKAKYKDGVLKLTLVKKEEEKSSQFKVEIQ